MSTTIKLENPTGIPELDAALQALNKVYSIDFSPEDYGDIIPIPTGSLALDIWLKINGLPDNRIIELIGDSGSLKTSLGLAFLKSRQDWRKANGIEGKFDLIIDLEHSLSRSFIEGFGIDFSQIIWKRFQTVEPAMQMCIDLPKTGRIHTVLYDSVDSNETIKQLEKNVGDSIVAPTAKIMSEAMRRISKIAESCKTQYIFINQWRMKPNENYGDPRTTPGGHALGYYSSLRLTLLKDNKGHPNIPNAALLRAKCIKTKCSSPINGELGIGFVYGQGFDPVSDVEIVAKQLEILRHSGGQTKAQWTADGDMEPLLPDMERGKEAGLKVLQDNPIVLARLRAACLRASGMEAPEDTFYQKQLEKPNTSPEE